MKRIYSEDTDTLMFVFRDVQIGEEIDHLDLDDDTSLELDCNGNPVGLTIEQAGQRGLPTDSCWAPPSRVGVRADE